MGSGREETNPVRNPSVMLRPASGVLRRRFRHDRRWFPTWHAIPVSLTARCNVLIGARFPVRHALVAVAMTVAALCGGNRAHAQQKFSSVQRFIPSVSEESAPFSGLSPQAAIQTSSPADAVHFCLPGDLEQPRYGPPISAARRRGNLNVGEPHTVRMIYFAPDDRPHRSSIVDSMKAAIKQVQAFYAE